LINSMFGNRLRDHYAKSRGMPQDRLPPLGQSVATPLFMGADWRGLSRSAENRIGLSVDMASAAP
jgi:hypothetical protein